ncbi:MAG: hypothetical protein ISR57_03800 [Bacteroidales bacterium]|nr:hypothetical protein [Bacteroidota bacterium]MBL6949749.1 hypothetical protein [Bacteroidales bacterium]
MNDILFNMRFNRIFFFLLFILTIILSFNYHHGKGYFNHRSEIYADKAGYYCYLPAALFFRFDPDLFPDSIVEKTGYGFVPNTDYGKVFIKYTYGVSLLVSPFFFATHFLSLTFDIPEEGGFSPWYHKMVNIAAAVYLILGLMLLRHVLALYFKPAIQYILILVVYLGTNLFFYTIVDSLMSHVYSFFLFALFLFALNRFLKKQYFGWFILLSFAGSLAMLIRPTNVILFSLFFFWDVRFGREIVDRIRLFFKPIHSVSLIVILFLVFLPQMLYWKYAWGSYFFYSYGQEGFNQWLQPYLLEVWFAPLNGVFLYSPVVILMVIGMFYMIWKRIPNGILILILFFTISYLFASWDTWYFGCSFGYRAFIEFYVLLLFPLGYLIRAVFDKKQWILITGLLVMMVLFGFYTFTLSLSYPGCYRGSTWDFTGYKINLARAGLLSGGYQLHQRNINPVIVEPSNEFSASGSWLIEDFKLAKPTRIVVESRVKNPGDSLLGARIVCSVERDYVPVLYQSAGLDSIMDLKGEWNYVKAEFEIPTWILPECTIKIYCWNRSKSQFLLDTTRVMFYVK